MVLLAIDLDMFGHGSAGQVLGRTDVDRVEYVRIGVWYHIRLWASNVKLIGNRWRGSYLIYTT